MAAGFLRARRLRHAPHLGWNLTLPRAIKILLVILAGLLSASLLAVGVVGGAYLYFGPQLPEPGEIGEAQLNEPLRVYTADGQLIAEYGAERRLPVTFEDIPSRVIDAFLAAEDDRFFEHPGVDYQGLLRASWNLLLTGEKTQGGSTITMQLARNLFLSRERTYTRKIKEIFLALRIEATLSKNQILEIYLNKIYLGNRSYGVGAAAEVYYDKALDQLSVGEVATLAGLPKAPSHYNPARYPERARSRRDYVLGRMVALDYISRDEYETAESQPVETATRVADSRYEADYVAEMVRQEVVDRFGEDAAYTAGYKVTTTLLSERQRAANRSLRRALLAYDARHEWRGAEAQLPAASVGDTEAMNDALAERPDAGGLVPAVVLSVDADKAMLYAEPHGEVVVSRGRVAWLNGGDSLGSLIKRGDIVRLAYTGDDKQAWSLVQIPAVQGALVALDPRDGAIQGLAGGFDFSLSKFNRAVQARRQPGSSFKPFLYAAALDNGFTPASIINDAPVVFDAPGLGRDWRPENYSGRIHGPTRLREALTHSRNLVTIRLLRSIGIDTAIDYISRFGLPVDQMPRDLSLSLGSATFSPLQMARADAVFANGGFLVEPYFIREIRDGRGDVVYQAEPLTACPESCSGADRPFAPRVIPAQTAWLMNSMMQDVIQHGTGRRAARLGRQDLAGKTGTTNEQRDAWFTGFNADLVAVAWVGFDKLEPLGDGETGGQAALPMWIDFMGSALADQPEHSMARPSGLVSVRIDPESGRLAEGGADGVFEIFREENKPEAGAPGQDGGTEEVEQLF